MMPDTQNHGKETQTVIQWSSSIFLAQLDKTREGERGYKYVTAVTRSCARKTVTFVVYILSVQNGVDRPTWLLRFVAFVHLPFQFFSVSRPFCRFTFVYEGHFVLCYKKKLEPLDRAMANFKRSSRSAWFPLLSACFVSLTPLWFEFGALFWLISIARYVFKSPSNCFWDTKYSIYCERVAYLILTTGNIFLRRHCSITSRKLYACLEKFLCFSCTIWSSLCSWSSMYRFIPPLIVLRVPQDSNVTFYAQVQAQVCWL